MTEPDTTPQPRRRRWKRWAVVLGVLAAIAGSWWLLRPRLDSRFIGEWRPTPRSHTLKFLPDGRVETWDEGRRTNESQWSCVEDRIVLLPSTSLPIFLNNAYRAFTGRNFDSAAEEYEVVTVTPDTLHVRYVSGKRRNDFFWKRVIDGVALAPPAVTGWGLLSSPDDGFAIRMPYKTKRDLSRGVPQFVCTTDVNDETWETWMVTVGPPIEGSPEETLAEVLALVVERGAKVIRQSDIELPDAQAAKEFVSIDASGDVATATRIVVASNRLYHVTYVGTQERIDSLDVRIFLDSFSIE